jgi:hypothetical protein
VDTTIAALDKVFTAYTANPPAGGQNHG